MKPIISQNLLNMLKNKIIPIISLKLFNDVEFLLNNLFVNNGSNHYFNLIYRIQTFARDMVESIVISTFEELDTDFKESAYRKTRIKSMLDLNIGSSMESHISHLIASLFSSRPKGFSTKRITKYLKLNDYKNNNINIFKLYLSTYSKKENN